MKYPYDSIINIWKYLMDNKHVWNTNIIPEEQWWDVSVEFPYYVFAGGRIMRECSCQQQSILSLYDDMLPYELIYLSHILKKVFRKYPVSSSWILQLPKGQSWPCCFIPSGYKWYGCNIQFRWKKNFLILMLTSYDDLHVHLIFDRFLFHMRVHLYEYIPVFTRQHNY